MRRYIRAGRVFPATGQSTIDDGVVAVESGRIVAVGRPQDFAEEAIVADDADSYPDGTLLPGLIDAHAHVSLAADQRPYERIIQDSDAMMALVAVQNMARHMSSGVTTIRDNGARNQVAFEVREAVSRGYVSGPRLLVAGRPVTHHLGHLWWCNGEADGEVEIRAAVRRLVAEGADHIKIMASGGATAGNTPYLASYTTDEIRVAVDAAHRLGRSTAAHCRARVAIQNALDAGVDCIEHAEFLVEGPITSHSGGVSSSGLMSYDRTLAERIAESGTYVSFTLQAGGFDTLARLRERANEGQLGDHEAGLRASLERYSEMKLEILRQLLLDGLGPKLAVSSDAGPFDTEFGRMDLGLTLAVQAGMSPSQALEASTRIPAALVGLGESLGTVEVGKVADLLVVTGDPTARIEDITAVRTVYMAGEPISVVPHVVAG